MDIKHLRIYVEVCRYESITKASRVLNMNEPSVSLAIRQIESYYGVKLFDRMNRRLYITTSGEALLYYATNIVEQFEAAKNSIQDTDNISELKIGSNVLLGEILLPGLLKTYISLYPEVKVSSIISNTTGIEDKLLKNELDLALVDNLISSDKFNRMLILKEEMIVVCSPQYFNITSNQLSLLELSKEKLLLRENGSGTRDSVDQTFKSAGLTICPVIESISNTALIEAAINGLGMLIISYKLIEKELLAGTLIPIKITDGTFLRNYYMIHHKNKYISKSMNRFIDLIKKLPSQM